MCRRCGPLYADGHGDSDDPQLPVDVRVVARFGSFNFKFIKICVPFPPSALPPGRAGNPVLLKDDDSYSGCQETRTYVRRSATYESRVGASRSVHTF